MMPMVSARSTGEFGPRGKDLPDVDDVLGGGKDVGAVGKEPEGPSAVVARRDEFAVVESGTVGECDTHAATFEVNELGHDISGHGSAPPGSEPTRADRKPLRSTVRPVQPSLRQVGTQCQHRLR